MCMNIACGHRGAFEGVKCLVFIVVITLRYMLEHAAAAVRGVVYSGYRKFTSLTSGSMHECACSSNHVKNKSGASE